jgi:putative membrane protein
MKRTQVLGVLVLLGLCCALAPGGVTAQDKVPPGGDAKFVAVASAAGLAEVNFGRLATKLASNADVRKFGQQMVEDHSKANQELNKMAADKRLAVSPAMDREHQGMFEKLARLSGADFDKAYVRGQLRDHEQAVRLFEDEAKNGSDEQLKSWASSTLPTLRDHLKHARALADKFGIKGTDTGRGE